MTKVKFLTVAAVFGLALGLGACGGSHKSSEPAAAGSSNPCAANPCGGHNPCGGANPCAGSHNPCGGANPCAGGNPCGGGDANPCGGAY